MSEDDIKQNEVVEENQTQEGPEEETVAEAPQEEQVIPAEDVSDEGEVTQAEEIGETQSEATLLLPRDTLLSQARIRALRERGGAIVMVSHGMDEVKALCDRALWLRCGEVAALGAPGEVAGQYEAAMHLETLRRTPDALAPVGGSGIPLLTKENRFGSQEMQITDLRLYGAPAIQIAELQSGQPFREEIDYLATQPVTAPIFGVTITKEDGVICYDASTASAGLSLPNLLGKGKVALQFERMDLMGGNCFIDVGVYREDWSYAYDYHWHVYTLQVNPAPSEKGVLRPPHHWEF